MSDSHRPPTIMVVDDSKTILRTAKLFLEQEKAYEVVPVDNGYSALAAVIEVKPDLIFLDVMMPRLDGYRVCMAIKNNPLFAQTPVVFLTSKDSPFDKARGLSMGCDDYLIKPFTRDSLLAVVGKYLPASKG